MPEKSTNGKSTQIDKMDKILSTDDRARDDADLRVAMPDAPAGAGRVRIKGHGYEPTDQLMANPMNWRVHPKLQRDALTEAIDRIGWIDEVTINIVTGNMVDGHLRALVADERQETYVPAKYAELSLDEEREVLLTKDAIAALAIADKDKLDTLVQGLDAPGSATQQMLDEMRAALPGSGSIFDDLVDSSEYGTPTQTGFAVIAQVADAKSRDDLMRELASRGIKCESRVLRSTS